MKKSWCIIFQFLFMQFLRFRMYGTERFKGARNGFALALIAGLLLLLPASGLAAKHALLIGIADYKVSGIKSLVGSVNDIYIVKKILKDRFQFHDSEITVLLNPDATHRGIKSAFAGLAERVREGDFVYIHYSGHGSYMKDTHGDETRPGVSGVPEDQTWVSYGSRATGAEAPVSATGKPAANAGSGGVDEVNLDRYDILDDEIGQWLRPIYKKTTHVAFVSDSCASATMTRGEAPAVRAVEPPRAGTEFFLHPFHDQKFERMPLVGINIGAARDNESAGEYFAKEDVKTYGLFTWHWVKALAMATPGETWEDIFKRTTAIMETTGQSSQQPQISGDLQDRNRKAFNGNFSTPQRTVAVLEVNRGGIVGRAMAKIRAGAIQGVTKESVYQLYQPNGNRVKATITIQQVGDFESEGEMKGNLQEGDLVVEVSHAFPYEPAKVFVKADLEEDKDLAGRIAGVVGKTAGYELTDNQKVADLVLFLLRPRIKDDGREDKTVKETKGVSGTASADSGVCARAAIGSSFIKTSPLDTLPASDKNRSPEVWFLTATEQLTKENLRLPMQSPERGMELISNNLVKMAKIREVKGLSATPGFSNPIDMKINIFKPDASCKGGTPECFSHREKGFYRKVRTASPSELNGACLKKDYILCVTVKNASKTNYYAYVLNITSEGKIEAVFPQKGLPGEEALMEGAGDSAKDQPVGGILLNRVGKETLKLLVTEKAIDISVIEQKAYERPGREQRTTKGDILDPLEQLLEAAANNVSRDIIHTGSTHWATSQVSVDVGE